MSALLHRNLNATPKTVVRGDGVYLIDADGKRYLDASGGAAVSCLGHSHAKVIAAVQAQVAKLDYAHTSFFTNEPAEDLAAHLIARAPKEFEGGRVAFVGSGSEAMEVTLKLVRQHFVEKGEPDRSHFIARRMSYHGNTLGALSVGGHMQRRALYAPLLTKASHISPCHAYRFKRDDESAEAYGKRVADELETEIQKVGPGKVAAFIAETMVGATLGCAPAVPGYFKRIREICDRHGVLLVLDEVMCGMGRTGTFFACEAENVCPDIITVAKGLGAGYQPIGAVLARANVVAPLIAGTGALANGHTYMAHAVACAGSLAVMKAIDEEGLLANVRKRGEEFRQALVARFGQHPHVGDIRGRGLFWALELVEDRETKAPFPRARKLAETIKRKAQDNGLICYPSPGSVDGEKGDHVVFAPPYIIDSGHVAEIVDKFHATLSGVLKNGA